MTSEETETEGEEEKKCRQVKIKGQRMRKGKDKTRKKAGKRIWRRSDLSSRGHQPPQANPNSSLIWKADISRSRSIRLRQKGQQWHKCHRFVLNSLESPTADCFSSPNSFIVSVQQEASSNLLIAVATTFFLFLIPEGIPIMGCVWIFGSKQITPLKEYILPRSN